MSSTDSRGEEAITKEEVASQASVPKPSPPPKELRNACKPKHNFILSYSSRAIN